MRDFTTELLTLPWRATQLGMQQLVGVPWADGGAQATANRARFAELWEGVAGRGPQPRRSTAWLGGGRAGLARGVVDWSLGNLAGDAWRPCGLLDAMADALRCAPDMLQWAGSAPDSRVAWSELRAKLDAFSWFATADRAMQLPQRGPVDLAALLPRAARLETFQALWTIEGLGYYFAAAALAREPRPRGLLSAGCGCGCGRRLPPACLIPLHTGMGLALATDTLTRLAPRGRPADVSAAVDDFLGLCRDNARPGYARASLEALGLIVRLLRPELVLEFDRQLAARDRDLTALFWHGVGRGLYFLPAGILPCSSLVWPAWQKACDEPPHELGRLNALAGFVWAVALVNLPDPSVLELLLARHGRQVPHAAAVVNGVQSAAALWLDWDADSDHLDAFCRYVPSRLDGDLADLWRRCLQSCADGSLARRHARLKRNHRLEELFRFDSAT